MTQADGPRLDGRNGEIWNLYLAGWTQERIADKHGISHQRVSQILAEVRAAIPDEQRQDLITTSAERLNRVLTEAFGVMGRTHYVTNGGKIVHDITEYATDDDGHVLLDDDGNPKAAKLAKLVDDAPVLQAIDRIVKTDAEIRKLLGLDAAQKLDANLHHGPADEALQQLLDEACTAAQQTEQDIKDGRA